MPPPNESFRFRDIGREVGQIFQSIRNRNFAALFFYGLAVGIGTGLGTALYLYNTSYFFAFSGPQIAITGFFVMMSPPLAYWAAPFFGRSYGKKQAAIGAILVNIALYPIPYILLLTGYWPALGSWARPLHLQCIHRHRGGMRHHRRCTAGFDDGGCGGGQRSVHRPAV